MDYTTEAKTEGVGRNIPANPVEGLTDILHETNERADCVLNLTRRINSHLFGLGDVCEGKDPDPRCFRDELTNTRSNLLAAEEELRKMCSLLGI